MIGDWFRDEYDICAACDLIIPIDMEYYQQDDCVLCKLCVSDKDKPHFVMKKRSTGVGSLNDWVNIFDRITKHTESGWTNTYPTNYYCNLNKKSEHYGKFAVNSYTDGDDFIILEDNEEDNEEVPLKDVQSFKTLLQLRRST